MISRILEQPGLDSRYRVSIPPRSKMLANTPHWLQKEYDDTLAMMDLSGNLDDLAERVEFELCGVSGLIHRRLGVWIFVARGKKNLCKLVYRLTPAVAI